MLLGMGWGREGGLGDNVEDRDVWGWREVGRKVWLVIGVDM